MFWKLCLSISFNALSLASCFSCSVSSEALLSVLLTDAFREHWMYLDLSWKFFNVQSGSDCSFWIRCWCSTLPTFLNCCQAWRRTCSSATWACTVVDSLRNSTSSSFWKHASFRSLDPLLSPRAAPPAPWLACTVHRGVPVAPLAANLAVQQLSKPEYSPWFI